VQFQKLSIYPPPPPPSHRGHWISEGGEGFPLNCPKHKEMYGAKSKFLGSLLLGGMDILQHYTVT